MLKCRSDEKELLDLGGEHYTIEEYERCMKILFRVNKLLGCFQSTVKTLKYFPPESTLLDVGCGSGDIIINLSQYYHHMHFKGIDISSDAINIANSTLQACQSSNVKSHVSFCLQSESEINIADNSVDIVLATMVCHHLSDTELVVFFKKALDASRKMVLIHDLHRNAIAYWFYKIFSPVIFHNWLITHDGLISIRRGFLRSELQALLVKAGITYYQLKWRFPFRWQLTLFKSEEHFNELS